MQIRSALLFPLALAVFCGRTSDFADLPYGVALGEPGAHSVVFWARLESPGRLIVRLESAGAVQTYQSAPARDDEDRTVRLAIADLPADTEHRYSAWADPDARDDPNLSAEPGERAVVRGRFRTLPAATAARPVRFVFGGDLAGQNVCRDKTEGFPIFATLRALRPDFFIGLGDLIYADDICTEVGRYGNAQIPRASGPAVALAEFRAAWRYVRADAGYREFLAQTPYFAVWDDHEVRNDFSPADHAAEGPGFPAELRGSPLLGPGLRAFLEYNPILSQLDEPSRLYRRATAGRHLELFILDTRQHRAANRARDAGPTAKSMLGETQRRWLIDGVRASRATWKVVVSSVPISMPTGSEASVRGRDGWARGGEPTGYERELREILQAFAEAGVKNLLFLTTDVHCAAMFRYRPFPATHPEFVLHEVAVGPLQAGVFPNREFDRAFGAERLFFYGPESADAIRDFSEARRWFNFGLVEVSDQGELDLSIRDSYGHVVHRWTAAGLAAPRETR